MLVLDKSPIPSPTCNQAPSPLTALPSLPMERYSFPFLCILVRAMHWQECIWCNGAHETLQENNITPDPSSCGCATVRALAPFLALHLPPRRHSTVGGWMVIWTKEEIYKVSVRIIATTIYTRHGQLWWLSPPPHYPNLECSDKGWMIPTEDVSAWN